MNASKIKSDCTMNRSKTGTTKESNDESTRMKVDGMTIGNPEITAKDVDLQN